LIYAPLPDAGPPDAAGVFERMADLGQQAVRQRVVIAGLREALRPALAIVDKAVPIANLMALAWYRQGKHLLGVTEEDVDTTACPHCGLTGGH
jgi:hypothetical protein